jgi:cytochrome c2
MTIGKLVSFCCLAACAAGPMLRAQEAADFFRQNCANCHTIGDGRLTGPDLKGVLNGRSASGSCGSCRTPRQ